MGVGPLDRLKILSKVPQHFPHQGKPFPDFLKQNVGAREGHISDGAGDHNSDGMGCHISDGTWDNIDVRSTAADP